jgi:hypothetical protein
MKLKTAIAAAALAVITAGVVTGCARVTEPFNDAPVSHKYQVPAEVYAMPNGYNNYAESCDHHGHRVFVIFHSSGYGSVFAINDPACKP